MKGTSEKFVGQVPIDILLISMPWATTTRPSIALGILDRLCAEAEIRSSSIFPHLDLSAQMGLDSAKPMSDERALYGLGEHLFAVDIFGREALESDMFLEIMCRLPLPAPFNDISYVRHLRDVTIPSFLDDAVRRMLATGARVFGFTATFNQVMASLAAASRLKKVKPDALVITGGACFDGEMGQEYHRVLPNIIDHVFMGEAEESFRQFLRQWSSAQSTSGIPGVTWFENGIVQLLPGQPLKQMDDSPMPNYFPFFEEVERIFQSSGVAIRVEALPFEGSRGCWWGQKNHCVFCGINKDLLAFREKSPNRVVDEILLLSHLHGISKLTATDWIISRQSRTQILETLRDHDLDLEVFYETRSDLDKQEVKLLRDSGALRVQPGIESFSTPVLKVMKKGTTGIRQIRFLKWAREYGVKMSYNILCGFPGDETQWYLDMADVMELVPHLQPPTSNANFLELHRFSPLFMFRNDFGIKDFALRVDYRFNFPKDFVDPIKIGYFFEYKSEQISDVNAYIGRVRSVITPWIKNWESRSLPRCEYIIGPEFVEINDTRFGDGKTITLRNIAKDLFLLLDDIRTRHEISTLLSQKYPHELTSGIIDQTIDELIGAKILMAEGNTLLALPIAVKPRSTEDLTAYALELATTEQMAAE
jgi:ribosomal peptide maturation radical SAM protein 1